MPKFGLVPLTVSNTRGGNVTSIYKSGDVKGGTIIAGDENEVKK